MANIIHSMKMINDAKSSYLFFKDVEKKILTSSTITPDDIMLIIELRIVYNIYHLGFFIDSGHFLWMKKLIEKYIPTFYDNSTFPEIFPNATTFIRNMYNMKFRNNIAELPTKKNGKVKINRSRLFSQAVSSVSQ